MNSKESPDYAKRYQAWMEAVIRDAQRHPDGTLRVKANGEKV